MDYENLKNIFKRKNNKQKGSARVKLMILCSPHNPVGRVWGKEELQKLGEICINNNILVVSDEIHADFTFFNNRHTVFASLTEELAANSITLFSPSKTFNIAGLNGSIAIIPNKKIRKEFNDNSQGIMGSANTLSLTAMEAAYSDGEDWMQAQLKYLEDNLSYANDFINNKIAKVKTYKPEGTYLMWMDFKDLGLKSKDLNKFLINKARIALDAGTWFGSGGEGYMRLNVACPHKLLEQGLNRIKAAITEEMSENSG